MPLICCVLVQINFTSLRQFSHLLMGLKFHRGIVHLNSLVFAKCFGVSGLELSPFSMAFHLRRVTVFLWPIPLLWICGVSRVGFSKKWFYSAFQRNILFLYVVFWRVSLGFISLYLVPCWEWSFLVIKNTFNSLQLESGGKNIPTCQVLIESTQCQHTDLFDLFKVHMWWMCCLDVHNILIIWCRGNIKCK